MMWLGLVHTILTMSVLIEGYLCSSVSIKPIPHLIEFWCTETICLEHEVNVRSLWRLAKFEHFPSDHAACTTTVPTFIFGCFHASSKALLVYPNLAGSPCSLANSDKRLYHPYFSVV